MSALLSVIAASRRRSGSVDYNTPPITVNLAANWDASDASTLYDAVSGGSLVASNGAVARWEDKSGNGYHATQSTGVRRPIRKLAVSGGRDGVRFDGETTAGLGDFLSHSINEPSAMTVFAVVKDTSGDYRQIFGAAVAGAAVTLIFTAPAPASDFCTIDSSPAARNGGVALGANYNVLTLVKDAGVALYTNGTAGYSTGSFTPYVGDSNDRRTIGGYANPGVEASVLGDICQILVYSAALNSTDRQAVEAWLKAKWATP